MYPSNFMFPMSTSNLLYPMGTMFPGYVDSALIPLLVRQLEKKGLDVKVTIGVVRKLLTVCLCGFCPGRLV